MIAGLSETVLKNGSLSVNIELISDVRPDSTVMAETVVYVNNTNWKLHFKIDNSGLLMLSLKTFSGTVMFIVLPCILTHYRH